MRTGSLLPLCREQLDNAPVTQLKVCKPFYLLNTVFHTLLPDHSPSFSHNGIAASCIQATSYSSSNTLSCSLITQEPQILLWSISDLYHSTFTSKFSSIQYFQSSRLNIWTFFHCLLAHFAPHLCLQPQWFSGFLHKRNQNLHLMPLAEFFKTQTCIPYIRNLSRQAGKFIVKDKIKISQSWVVKFCILFIYLSQTDNSLLNVLICLAVLSWFQVLKLAADIGL